MKRSLKGKVNPKTKKAYTDSDLYAIAVSAFKTKFGKAPTETKGAVVAENVKINFNSYFEVVE